MIDKFPGITLTGGTVPMLGPAVVVFVGLALAGCQQQQASAPPVPMALTAKAAGHYCQMIVLDHPGPKGQVHLAGSKYPLWFSQVRDAIAFVRKPDQDAEVAVVYVSDMGEASSWYTPEPDKWVGMRTAYYVIGSSRRGGMGGPELVPFAQLSKAENFARTYGGRIITYRQVTDDMVLGPVDIAPGGKVVNSGRNVPTTTPQ